MNRKNRFIALLLTIVFCLVMSAVTVSAVGDEESYDTTPAESDTYVEPTEDTAPPETAAPTETQPKTQAPETNAPVTEAPATTAPTTSSYYEEDDYSDDYDDGGDSYEERESNTSSEKAETAAVYDAEEDDVSTDTLKKGDWAKIAAQLKNANGDDADDFAFIRNNDAGGSNNGEWMLILGIALEAAGLAIVIALVVMRIRRNKAVKAGNFAHRGAPNRPEGRPSRANGARPPQRASHAEQESRAQRYSKKQRSKFDTADIVVPKNAKSSNGRYKQRH